MLACAVIVSIVLPRLIPLIGSAESWLEDLRVSLLAPAEPQDLDIIVVAITEDTLAGLPYRSPVDRGFIADLVELVGSARKVH